MSVGGPRRAAERLIGAGGVVAHWAAKGWLRPGLSTERARDVVWMLTSPAVYVKSIDRGWTTRNYRDWLAGAVLSWSCRTCQADVCRRCRRP